MRRLAAAKEELLMGTGFDLRSLAALLPTTAWLIGSVSSPQFWSGAESDDLAAQVASLLRTCFKMDSKDELCAEQGSTAAWFNFRQLINIGNALAAIQSYAHAAWKAAGSNSSSSSSRNAGSNTAGEASSSIVVQLSSYTEPCPHPRLQIASLLLMNCGKALAEMLQSTEEGAANAALFECNMFAECMFECLGCVHWLKSQLQQLLLPGDPRKAAAALQGLQEQQQQLQQARRLHCGG
jgi:hypothetical protein